MKVKCGDRVEWYERFVGRMRGIVVAVRGDGYATVRKQFLNGDTQDYHILTNRLRPIPKPNQPESEAA